MATGNQWKEAVAAINLVADGSENRKALSGICERISNSSLSSTLSVDTSGLPHRIYVRRSDGSYPSKSIKFEAISGDRIEICFYDNAARTERYFFPHTPAREAVSRGMRILANLNWDTEAKQYRNIFEWFLGNTVGRTPDN
ncbi:MAG: hypothetical protein KDH88_05985 [Chromatiales bacterium]|nr:hypothetical protein [Chromatiales bacterium]